MTDDLTWADIAEIEESEARHNVRTRPMRRGLHGPAWPHLASIAIHEAGHAVAAVAMYMKIKHATCAATSTGEVGGHVDYMGSSTSPEARLAVTLAGPAAESIANVEGLAFDGPLDALHWWQERDNEDLDWDDPQSSKVDYPQALTLLGEAYAPHWRGRALREAWLRVDRWIRLHWSAVEAVADKLTRRRKLSGRELYQIAARHGVRFPDRRLLPKGRSHEEDFWKSYARHDPEAAAALQQQLQELQRDQEARR